MTDIDELNREWTPGWHIDLEYQLPRFVFSKNTGSGRSTCYIYESKDIEAHLKTCGLTNLEYLEAKSFYRDHCIELLKKRMENRIPQRDCKAVLAKNIAFHTYHSDSGFGGVKFKGDK